jgi:hypothetical protein
MVRPGTEIETCPKCEKGRTLSTAPRASIDLPNFSKLPIALV